MGIVQYKVPTMAEKMAAGEKPQVLFWVGCAGSFDERAQRITRAFVKILNALGTDFAVLGTEESCTGDPAKRTGNEFLFQMQAMTNVEVMNAYEVTDIITTCPHCYNIIKNEYPALGGEYKVRHHTEFLQEMLDKGKLSVKGGSFKGKKITYHDSCYLGRANGIYEAPRSLLEALDTDLKEMADNKERGMCCGAGGAQVFKEEEEGSTRVNWERTQQAIDTGADVVAMNCPFCMIMYTDGIKTKDKAEDVKLVDLAEMIAHDQGLEDLDI